MSDLLSFNNDKALKSKFVARLAAHHKADNIIKGTGWNGYRGCAVGCTLEKYDHKAYETELGLPEWLARLEDEIFEGLPVSKAADFARDFLKAIPVGVSVENVRWQMAIARHTQDLNRLKDNKEPYAEQCRNALIGVIKYCELQLTNPKAAESAAESARSAAESAWSAARSAAESARSAAESARSAAESARSAAESAAESAWSAARSAAESAWSAAESAWSAARSAAESAAHYEFEAGLLIKLLKACK